MNQEVLRERLRLIIHDNLSHPDDYQLLIKDLETLISEYTAVVERNARIDELNLLPLVWGDDTRKNQNEYLVGRFQELQEALNSKEKEQS